MKITDLLRYSGSTGRFRTLFSLFRRHETHIALAVIIIAGAMLRLTDFSDLARFNADQARDAAVIDVMSEGTVFPLLGPKAGGTTFRLGPAFYYLQFLSGLFFGHDPAGIAIFVPILSILSLLLLFRLLTILFPVRLSLPLTLLSAVSFYGVKYARFAWNPNPIPFFVLALLSLLLHLTDKNGKRSTLFAILLGLVIGIGTQLHTVLLFLFPAMLFLTAVFLVVRDRKLPIFRFAIIIGIALALHVPVLVSELSTGGANTTAFLNGIDTKTEHRTSLVKTVLLDLEFFGQGTAYALTGIEPDHGWTNPIKLIGTHDPVEISLFLGSLALLSVGLIGFVFTIFRRSSGQRRRLLALIGSFSGLSFLLFLPLGNELNIRFFIILLFLPYVFMGILVDSLTTRREFRPVVLIGFTTLTAALLFTNLRSSFMTYDLSKYRAAESAYGGISLGEAQSLADFVRETAHESAASLFPFEFARSVRYLVERTGMPFPEYDQNKAAPDSFVFVIEPTDSNMTGTSDYASRFDLVSTARFGRFTVTAMRVKPFKDIRVGFITDIHAKTTSKSTAIEGIISDSGRGLSAFVQRMNDSFHPDFVVDGGDFIDGTNRRGPKSLADFDAAETLFDRTDSPRYHVIGNHDLRGLSVAEWIRLSNSPTTDVPYYSFDTDDLRTIVLDGIGTPTDSGTYVISDEQIRWFEERLREASSMRKIVFIHVPITGVDMLRPEQLPPIADTPSAALYDLAKRYGVLAVFSGHVELARYSEDAKTRFFTLPGLYRSKNKNILWLDCYYEVTIGRATEVRMFYRKDPGDPYQEVDIPSPEFDALTK
ncbi:MAG: hypothetical protein HGB37_03855 [Candidatus Moranbacteria bacterium]|nr:hypothetical protein [Candidatus Moranbacteria bacterium]